MDQRCDGNADCDDKSDEMHCQKIISFDGDSLKLPPPPPKKYHLGKAKQRVHLYTSIEIINFLQLDENEALMSLQIKLTMEWTDTRLEYIDLKTDQNMNTLSMAEMNEIWIPTLIFTNTKNRQQADFRNKSTFASIKINPGITGSKFNEPIS